MCLEVKWLLGEEAAYFHLLFRIGEFIFVIFVLRFQRICNFLRVFHGCLVFVLVNEPKVSFWSWDAKLHRFSYFPTVDKLV